MQFACFVSTDVCWLWFWEERGEVFCSTSWLVGQGVNRAYAQCTLAFDQVSTAGGSAGHPNVPPQGFVACSTVLSEGLVRGLTTTLHLVVQEVCIEWLMQVFGQFWPDLMCLAAGCPQPHCALFESILTLVAGNFRC